MRRRLHQPQRHVGIPILILAWAVCLPGAGSAAAPAGVWRVYRSTNGLADSACVALTVSSRGNVWTRHPPGRPVSVFDGFQFRTIESPGVGIYPIQESRSGQLWSLYPEGMAEYRRGQWVQYPLAEMQLDGTVGLSRPGRVVSLLPAERDSVLALLPDRLLKCDVLQNRAVMLRSASATLLGRFTDFVEARDGSVWLAGTNGLAHLPGPVRRLTPDAAWKEYEPPRAWEVRWMSRPMEDDEGGVTVVAETRAEGGKQVLRLADETWAAPLAGPEGLRNAWRGSGGTLWGHSRQALFRWDGRGWETVSIPGLPHAQ